MGQNWGKWDKMDKLNKIENMDKMGKKWTNNYAKLKIWTKWKKIGENGTK